MSAIAPVKRPSFQKVFEEQTEPPPRILEAATSFKNNLYNITLSPLKGATVFKMVDESKPPQVKITVLREAFPSWTEERCKLEVEIAKWIAASKVGPQVLNVSSDHRFMELEYFNGGVLHPHEPLNLQEIALCLRQFHSIGLPPSLSQNSESTFFRRFHEQYAILKEKYHSLPEALLSLEGQVLYYEKIVKLHPHQVLCHLDLHCHNIMRHDGQMKLIDYGMTGPDHAFFDLANFAMYHELSNDSELKLLAHYLGEAITPQKEVEYSLFRPLVYLNKVTWPLIRAVKKGANAALLQEVWKEEKLMPLKEAFDTIYTDRELTLLEEIRYAHAAYEQFYQKELLYLPPVSNNFVTN